MADYYAFLDAENVVTEVIAGKPHGDGVDWEAVYAAVRGVPPSQCKRTCHNTAHGEPFRENYAGIGYRFDPDYGPDGAFFPPEPPV